MPRCWRRKAMSTRRCTEPAPPVLLHREQRRYACELWHALSQGATDQQQHCRVRGEPGGQPAHDEEATNSMDGRGSTLPGTGQSCCFQRRILGQETCRVDQDFCSCKLAEQRELTSHGLVHSRLRPLPRETSRRHVVCKWARGRRPMVCMRRLACCHQPFFSIPSPRRRPRLRRWLKSAPRIFVARGAIT
jgi:hypothetical protein